MENIIIRKINKTYGGYEYIEFNQETKEYTTGNSSAHMGHGRDYIMITTSTKKELKEKEQQLLTRGYKEISTFGIL